MRLKETIAFVNNKGGVGKTTTVHNVAAGIVRHLPDARVLCIDLDAQGSLSSLLGWNDIRKDFPESTLSNTIARALTSYADGTLPVFRSNIDGVYMTPSCPALEGIEIALSAQMTPKQMLSQLFARPVSDYAGASIALVEDFFDYILIDCQPSLSAITINALDAADSVVIPAQIEGMSIIGLSRVLNAVKIVKGSINADLVIRGILLTMADERTNMAKSLVELMESQYSGMVFRTHIRRSVRLGEGQILNEDVHHYSPECTTARDYDSFVSELLGEQ